MGPIKLAETNCIILPLGEPRAARALETGWLAPSLDDRPKDGPKDGKDGQREGNDEQTAPRRVVARDLLAGEPIARVLFEFLPPRTRRPRGLGPWLLAFRAFSLTATVTPGLAVWAVLRWRGVAVDIGIAIAAILGVICLQIAINVFNDVEDYRRLIDLPGTLGGSGVIQQGWWTPLELKRLAYAALALGVLFGVPCVLRRPVALLPIGALGTAGVLLYSAKKAGLKYHALGDATVFLLCGPALTLGFALPMANGWQDGLLGSAIWIGVFFGLLATALLHVNNLQDMRLDRERGVSTLAILLGFRGAQMFLVALYLAAFLVILAGWRAGALPALALLGAMAEFAMAAPWLVGLRGASGADSPLLSGCRVRAAQIHLISGMALGLGIAAAAHLN